METAAVGSRWKVKGTAGGRSKGEPFEMTGPAKFCGKKEALVGNGEGENQGEKKEGR